MNKIIQQVLRQNKANVIDNKSEILKLHKFISCKQILKYINGNHSHISDVPVNKIFKKHTRTVI